MKLTLVAAAFLVTFISAVRRSVPVAPIPTFDALAILAGPPVSRLVTRPTTHLFTVGPAHLLVIIIAILAGHFGYPIPPSPSFTFLIHFDALAVTARPSWASLHVLAVGPANCGTLVFTV